MPDVKSLSREKVDAVYGDIVEVADDTTMVFDLNKSNIFRATIDGDRVFELDNEVEGMGFTILVVQGSGGSHVPTLWDGIRWLGGGDPPTFSTAEDYIDALTFTVLDSGVEYLGNFALGAPPL